MTTAFNFRRLGKDANTREIAQVVTRMQLGGLNNTGEVTFTASATTTTVQDKRIGVNSVVTLMPTTASAQAAYIAGWRVSTITAGTSFVITHASAADVDQTFRYAITG
jgi:hypothetical protein